MPIRGFHKGGPFALRVQLSRRKPGRRREIWSTLLFGGMTVIVPQAIVRSGGMAQDRSGPSQYPTDFMDRRLELAENLRA